MGTIINSNDSCIDLIGIFLSHRKIIYDFVMIVQSKIAEVAGKDLHEYRKYKHLTICYSHKSQYRLLLQTALTNNIEPYMHIKKFFSDDELEVIDSFQKGSTRQVDTIIELVDAYGAIDDPLRKSFYDLFSMHSK